MLDKKKEGNLSLWQKMVRGNRNIVYTLFIAMSLIIIIYEIPSMSNETIELVPDQFKESLPSKSRIQSMMELQKNTKNNRISLIDSNRNDDNLDHKTVFITGIGGFIGMSLARKLSNKTNFPHTRIIGIDSFNTYYIPKLKRERGQKLIRMGVNVIFGNLCNEILINDIFDEYNISIVVHLAAQAGVRYSIKYPHSYVENNIDCSLTLFEIIKNKKLNIPIVYASSSSIYGDNDFKNEPLKDTIQVNNYVPKSVYAASKVATENLASVYSKMYDLTMVGLRFFTVYGSYGRPDMALWLFSQRLLNNEKIMLYNHGKMMRDFTHWTDIVQGIQLAMKYALRSNIQNNKGSNTIFNLGKGNVRSLHEFVTIILQQLQLLDANTDIEKHPLIELAPTPGGEVLFTSADLTKSKSILGYSPKTELEIGIPEFIKWFRNDWIIKEKIIKKYLLISTFYIAMVDPRFRQNNIQYSNDFDFAVNYIKNWYQSIKNVMNIDDLALAQIDCVIIHDGLSNDIFIHFPDIIFINMGQYPNPLKGHTIRRSPNDIRYFHIYDYLLNSADNEYEIVIMTDLHDVMFGKDPFKYLITEKGLTNNIENKDLYIGCETMPEQSWWNYFKGNNNKLLSDGTWRDWMKDRLNGCFKQDIVNKCMQWIDSGNHLMPTNPGILAANKHTMLKYLQNIKYQLTKTNNFNTTSEQNCNYAAVYVSIIELCYEDKQCSPINDDAFHSPYRHFIKPKQNINENDWVIYHK